MVGQGLKPFDFKTCLFLLSVFALLAYCLFSIRDPTDQIPNFPEAVSLLKQGALEVQNKVGDARVDGTKKKKKETNIERTIVKHL
ncbi:hypothetical protein QYF36_015829 [Acer negundo]|nr:hypothetical protein QYF36_015829 [Acer negundo]